MSERALRCAALVLVLCGPGAAGASEPGPARPEETVSMQQRDGLYTVGVGGARPAYLIDPRTETCALLGPSGALLAVDCSKLARGVPQTQRVITWTSAAAPPPPPPPPELTEKDVETGIRCKGTSCSLDRSLMDRVLASSSYLATSARFVRSIREGKGNGFKIFGIRPGSLFARMLLENGDLIRSINGLDLSTPDNALEAYARLKQTTELAIEVERRGQLIILKHRIR